MKVHDTEVRFASKGDSTLPMRLRRLVVQRTDGKTITLLTNDLERAAVDIAALYKARWQIELLFRWIKQHLHIRRFLGNNDNAIRLQLFAAMIAYALLRTSPPAAVGIFGHEGIPAEWLREGLPPFTVLARRSRTTGMPFSKCSCRRAAYHAVGIAERERWPGRARGRG